MADAVAGGNGAAAPAAAERPRATTFELIKQMLFVYVVAAGLTALLNRRGGAAGPPDAASMSGTGVIRSPRNGITLDEAIRQTSERQRQAEENYRSIQSVASKAGISIPFTPAQRVFPTIDADGIPLGPHLPLLLPDSVLDLRVFVTQSAQFDYSIDAARCVWHLERLVFNWTYAETPQTSVSLNVSREFLRSNATLYAHVIVTQSSPHSDSPSLASLLAEPASLLALQQQEVSSALLFYRLIPLIRYRRQKPTKSVRSLLSSSNSTLAAAADTHTANESAPLSHLAYWVPTLNLSMILDTPAFPRNSIPPAVAKFMQFEPEGNYQPIIYHNQFWQLSKNLVEINDSLLCDSDSGMSGATAGSNGSSPGLPPPGAGCGQLHLGMSYSHLSFFYWQLQSSMEDQWRSQQSSGMGTERESDMMREMLLETSPWLLVLTALVSLLHTVFDMLAFKNDVQFWRKKKSMAGMSVRSLVVNCFFQTIILLYLFDSDTSYMILISSSVGLCIEYWKLSKAFSFAVTFGERVGWLPALPRVSYALSASYTSAGDSEIGDTSTEKIDAEATTHLLYVLVPLMAGYSIFSLVHSQHKSFYSWALGSLVGFVYAFGFVLMTPQLWINYKLRSVAHMPWKAMVYKALNTFVDDLFSFIIKMPTMHRLACFRDDLIFFVYLYQMWAYPVDHTRTNEFGQGGGEGGEEKKETIECAEGVRSS